MKTLNTKLATSTFKPVRLTALAISLSFGTLTLSAVANDNDTINGWQSSLAAEFAKLDSSGNGLLLPLEASKGKAFSKKTFAVADADGDGTIDENEYINYKTSLGEKNIPANNMAAVPASSTTSTSSMPTEMPSSGSATSNQSANEVVTENNTDMSQDRAEPEKRKVGTVIDDGVITTKVKAAIFNTPNLKTLQISVETRKGEVLLSGFVDNETAKTTAEEVAKAVDGVTSVKNGLEVKK
jgi:hypothetical protein